MKSEPNSPLCYSCKFRRSIPGDAHSECVHSSIGKGNDMVKLLAMLGGRRGEPEAIAASKLNIIASPHGINMGWFAWPYNFDPVWLQQCDGFEKKANQRQTEQVG